MKQAAKVIAAFLAVMFAATFVYAQTTENTMGSIYVNGVARVKTALRLMDTNASHYLAFVVGSNLTDNRTLTVTTGDSSRTIDISSGDVALPGIVGAPTTGQVLTATSSTAATWQAPTGGSGATNVLVFRPAAVADTSQVFNDWPSLYAAFQATEGNVDIVIDPVGQGDEYTVTVPSGTYDLEDRATLSANEYSWARVQWASGVDLTNLTHIGRRLEVLGSADGDPVMVGADHWLTIDEDSGITAGAGAGSFVQLSGASTISLSGHNAYLWTGTGYAARVTGGTTTIGFNGAYANMYGSDVVRAESGATLNVLMYGGHSSLAANGFDAAIGSTVNIKHTAATDPVTLTNTQTGILGTLNRTYENYATQLRTAATDKCLARVTASGGAVEEVTCTDAFQSIWDDATVGAMLDTLGGTTRTGTGGVVCATQPTLVKPTALKYNATPLATAYSATLNIDVSANNDHEIGTLTGNVAFTFTNGQDGDSGIVIVKMGGSGSYTVSFAASGRTVLKDSGLSNLDPGTAAGTVTIYAYAFYTVGGTAYVVVSKSILA